MAIHVSLLKPFFLFCKFLFLFPHKDYWKICDSWQLYSIIAYVGFIGFEITSVRSLLGLNLFNTYTVALIAFSSSIDLLTIGTHITAFVLKKELMSNFLESIGNLYDKNSKLVSTNAIFWSLIASTVCLADGYNYTRLFLQNWEYWSFIAIVFIYLIMYTIMMQFIYFLDFLNDNFQTLARSIGNTESALLKQIEEHWNLVELCHNINEFYCKQLLLGMFRMFVILTLDSYYVVNTLFTFMNDPRVLSMVIPSMTNFTWSMVMLLATSHTCEITKEAADSFHSALSCVLRRNKSLNNEMLVMYVVMKPTVHLNVAGFFSLGRHAINSVIAVVVTYLVILVQFSKPVTK
ncbi:Gustatory receptor 168 [Halyomorpha halys]|nr:Gustatory receptor 168 [Halyomorpha halys]